jgi:uncharacterized protein YndB with AHSA1/START domain
MKTRFVHALYLLGGVAAALVMATPAAAAVTDLAPDGFAVEATAHIAASPDKVYAAIGKPAQWWSPDHTFSRNAANLSLDEEAGGCFCEKLPNGGSVQHMIVVYAAPGKMLRLRGALGPFQAFSVDGVWTWTLAPSGNDTDVTAMFLVGGHMKGGFANISGIADGVVTLQTARLKQFVETGTPNLPSDKGATP